MTHFYIIRHGETEWNKEGRLQGHEDSPLTPDGIEQVSKTAKKLASAPIDHIYSSDLGRAIQTARIIAKPHKKPVIPDPKLREVCFGEYEGMDVLDYQKMFGPRHDKRLKLSYEESIHFRIHPTFESIYETSQRMLSALKNLHEQHSGSTIAVITHGAVMRYTLTSILNIHVAKAPHNCVSNAAYMHLEYENGFMLIESEGINLQVGEKNFVAQRIE